MLHKDTMKTQLLQKSLIFPIARFSTNVDKGLFRAETAVMGAGTGWQGGSAIQEETLPLLYFALLRGVLGKKISL